MIDTIQPYACQELLVLLNSKYPWCYPPASASANILVKQDDTLLYMVDYRRFPLNLFCPKRQCSALGCRDQNQGARSACPGKISAMES